VAAGDSTPPAKTCLAHFDRLFQHRSLLQHERTHVIDQLAQLRARLESAINGNLVMIQGLTTTIAAQPDIDEEAFARIARGLISAKRPLRNIGGAPGLIISLMYPLDSNEAAIGLDYRTYPGQRDAALHAVETGLPVVAGPLPLVQGGTGLIARQAVFIPDASGDADRRLWARFGAIPDLVWLKDPDGVYLACNRRFEALFGASEAERRLRETAGRLQAAESIAHSGQSRT
jgi:sensor domain CHASE-containing protein